MSINRMFGYTFGAVYALVGAVGFAVTGGLPFAGTEGNRLLLFAVNPLHNIVHLAVGALLIGGAVAGNRWARRINATVGGVYLLVGVLGLFLVGTSLNILSLNHPDNALHFATAILAIAVASTKSEMAPMGSRAVTN